MNKNTLRSTSRRYKILLHILFYAIPLSYAAVWFFANSFPREWLTQGRFLIHAEITPLMRLLCFFATMIKGSLVMAGLWSLMQLFTCYERAEFFSEKTVQCCTTISRCLLWWVAAGIITEPLISLILTMNNPAGQRAISLSFQSADLTALIIGGVLSVIASVMDKGRMLKEEAELTI